MQEHEKWEKPWKTAWPRRATASEQEQEEQRRRDAPTVERARAARALDPRPNVLFLLTDQQTAAALSCAGNPYVNTPNMDRLAQRGVRFAKSYCTDPVCTPSRGSLLTGRMPHELGLAFISESPEPTIPNFGQVFRQAGYETAWCGKWHLPQSDVLDYDGIPGFDNIAHPGESQSLHGHGDATDSLHANDAAFLLRWEFHKIGLPWLCGVSLTNPHDICHWTTVPPRRHLNIAHYPPLPANFAVPPDEPDVVKAIRGNLGPATNQEIPRTTNWDDAQWRAYVEVYYHLTEQVDRSIGVVLDALELGGWLESTLVILTSDHGDGCGAHRWAAKNCFYEEPMTVPMLVSFPGRLPEGAVDEGHLVSGLDVMPTMCDYAGVDTPTVCGRSLRAIIEEPHAAWRDCVVAELNVGSYEKLLCGRMVRSASYKYCVYSTGRKREQLFDMSEDPGEMNDLSGRADFADVVRRHRDMLREWMRLTGDSFSL